MILYLFASAAIALGIIGLAIAMREKPLARARAYPQGSYERRTLEGVRR